MAFNTALKVAFIETGKKQIEVAKRIGIDESRMSKIVNGHVDATDDEKSALAKILRRSIDQLFPGVAA